jgi:hypothetical protein
MVSGTVARRKAQAPSVRNESPVRTELHWSFQYCFNCVCMYFRGVWNRGEARAPSVLTESPVRTEPHWSFHDQYCFNCVCMDFRGVCPEPWQGASAERSDRKPCANRTAVHWSFQYCFNFTLPISISKCWCEKNIIYDWVGCTCASNYSVNG